MGLKNEFELATVNEQSVFELSRFDCTASENPWALYRVCSVEAVYKALTRCSKCFITGTVDAYKSIRGTAFQTGLQVRAVWSYSLQGTLWVAKDSMRVQADSEDFDQPVHLRRLI